MIRYSGPFTFNIGTFAIATEQAEIGSTDQQNTFSHPPTPYRSDPPIGATPPPIGAIRSNTCMSLTSLSSAD